jgi:hypothetical protein
VFFWDGIRDRRRKSEDQMRLMFKSGAIAVMTGCAASPAQPPAQAARAPDRRPLTVVPIAPPAEVDPVPRHPPGQNGLGDKPEETTPREKE